MRLFVIALCALIVLGCATYKKSEISDSYAAKEGYFLTRPNAVLEGDFRPCEKSKIVEIQDAGIAKNLAAIVEQGGQKKKILFFLSSGVDASTFMSKYFGENLLLADRKVKIQGKSMSSKELVCKRTAFTGMTREELLFVLGEPAEVNRTVHPGMTHEQWVYRCPGCTKGTYYYFRNGKMTSWQD